MIAVGENGKPENKIVFMKGKIDSPIITSVIEINESDETKLEERRREIYEAERRGVQRTTEGVFRRYYQADFKVYKQRNDAQNGRYNNKLRTERGRSGKKAPRIIGFRVTD